MALILDWYVILSLMTFGIAAFLAIFSIAHARSDIRNAFLGAFIMVLMFNLYHDTLVHSRLLIYQPYVWGYGGSLNPFLFVLGFFFVKYSNRVIFSKTDLLHLFLPIGYFVFRAVRASFSSREISALISYYEQPKIREFTWDVANLVDLVMAIGFSSVYLICSFYSLQKVSSPSIRRWALLVVIFCSLPFLVTLCMLQSSSVQQDWQIALVAQFLQIGFLSWFTIRLPLRTPKGMQTALKYQHSNLSAVQSKLYQNRLETLMSVEKLYVQQNLSLSDVAQSLAINQSYLSQIINGEMGLTFTDYINSLRVAEAQRLLSDTTQNIYTLEAIAYKVGFNSRSTFYRAFQKFVKMTPSQFQQQRNDP